MDIRAADLASHGQDVLDFLFLSATDVSVMTDDGTCLGTHRIVLGAVSTFLKNLLQGVADEENVVIHLPDFHSSSLKCLLQYLRTGLMECSTKKDLENVTELVQLLKVTPRARELNKTDLKGEFRDNAEKTRIDLIKIEATGEMNEELGESNQENEKFSDNEELGLNDKKEKCTEQRRQCVKKGQTVKYGFKCTACEKKFKSKVKLLSHSKIHHEALSEINRRVVCDICGGHYKDSHTLRIHVQTQHVMTEKPFSCEECGDMFKTKGSLKIHRYKHVEERSFVCDHCGFQTKNKYLLKAHINTHKKVKNFKCEQCPKSFNHQFILDKHQRIHTGERPYSCDQCSTTFTTGIHLRRHKKTVHNMTREFLCTICSAPFKRMGELKRHIILHSGEKPFFCNKCGETFRHREAGRRHIKSLHPENDVGISFKPSPSFGELSAMAAKRLPPSSSWRKPILHEKGFTSPSSSSNSFREMENVSGHC